MTRIADKQSVIRSDRFVAWMGKRTPPGLDYLRAYYGVAATRVRAGGVTAIGGVLIAPRSTLGDPEFADRICLVAGDDGDVDWRSSRIWSGNASWVMFDQRAQTMSAHSSLSGLPPLYYTTYAGGVLIATDLPSIIVALDQVPTSDALGVADTIRWGYPIEGRTLFTNIRVLSPSCTLQFDDSGKESVTTKPWLDFVESRSTADLIDESISAFEMAVARMQIDSCFISLSGGLDSRMVALAASRQGFRPTCVTVSPQCGSTDGRQARAVSAALGFEHETISLSEAFRKRLPALLAHSATVTGGVKCIGQCSDAFMYEMLNRRFRGRVSGNIGNQIGRGGVESIPSRARVSLLDVALRTAVPYAQQRPWYLLSDSQEPTLHMAVRMRESMWFSLANYCVGLSFLPQLTPYSDSAVMLSAIPLLLRTYGRSRSVLRLRGRDILHRLFGPKLRHSFQRQYLSRYGDRINSVPINLGWHAPGGWFSESQFRGMKSLLGTFIQQRTNMRTLHWVERWVAQQNPIAPLVDPQQAIRTSLREMFLDTMHSSAWQHISGLDITAARIAIREYATGADERSRELVPVFEIALGREGLQQLLNDVRSRTSHTNKHLVASCTAEFT